MLIITITDSDKSVDEEEYMFFRMNREKMAGENLYNIIIEGSLRAVNRTRKLK